MQTLWLPKIWRRGWDSNPRTRLGVTHFPGVRLRPLGHLSINFNLLQPPGGMDSGLPGPRPPGALRASKIAPGDFVEPTNTVRCYTLSRRALPVRWRPPLHAAARVPEAARAIKFTGPSSSQAPGPPAAAGVRRPAPRWP